MPSWKSGTHLGSHTGQTKVSSAQPTVGTVLPCPDSRYRANRDRRIAAVSCQSKALSHLPQICRAMAPTSPEAQPHLPTPGDTLFYIRSALVCNKGVTVVTETE